jgi:tRNA 2-thiouridine synthesizing protein A
MGREVENDFQSDRVLDLRGWSCPWCIVKAKSWLRRMVSGEVLEVISTDPELQKNFPQVLESGGDQVIRVERHKKYYRILVQRG